MASRFISAGSLNTSVDPTPSEQQSPPSSTEAAVNAAPSTGRASAKPAVGTTGPGAGGKNQKEWERVQREVEEERKARDEARMKEASGEEKSLYDILQANKAAKQAAFEEKTRIRNQFRALDDDEVDFLDDVRAAKRAEEDRVRKDTEDRLKAFRAARRVGDEGGDEDDGDEDGGFGGRRKRRRRGREGRSLGVRRREGEGEGEIEKREGEGEIEKRESEKMDGGSEKGERGESEKRGEVLVSGKKGLGLVDYGSDDD